MLYSTETSGCPSSPPCLLTERVGNQDPTITDVHVVAFHDVVDVGGNRSVCSDAMLFHSLDQFAFGQIPRWRRVAIAKPQRGECKTVPFLKIRQLALILAGAAHE